MKSKIEKIKKVKFSIPIFNKEMKEIKKQKSTCKIKKRNYNSIKARMTALRLEREIQNEKIYRIRHKKEVMLEYLLYKNKLYSHIIKLHRLTDKQINKMINVFLVC